MNVKIPRQGSVRVILIGVLYLVRTLSLHGEIFRPGRPYACSTILMAQSFIIKSQMRIPSNDTLHYFLSVKCSDDKLFKVCRLTQIPDRRTIDRRFQNLPVGTSSGRWEACSYQKEWLMTRLHQRTVLCQKQMVLHCTNPT